MAASTELTDDIFEASTPLLTFTFLDELGAAVQPDTATLTLYDRDSRQIINSQDGTNIIGSVAAGVASVRFAAADTAIRATGRHHEWHTIRIDWTWGASLAQSHLIHHRVVNAPLLP